MYEKQILEWLGAHPALVHVFLVSVAWPLVTGLLSFAHGWLDQRAPRFTAALRASGFDAAGFIRAVLAARTQPPPPSAGAYREPAAIEPAAPTPRTAPRVPPLPLLAALGVLVYFAIAASGGCTAADRTVAANVAQIAVPGCTVGLSIADAPELAPICATIPEIEAAIAALFAERHAAAGTMAEHASIAAWSPTGAEVHRKIVRMRAAVIGGAK